MPDIRDLHASSRAAGPIVPPKLAKEMARTASESLGLSRLVTDRGNDIVGRLITGEMFLAATAAGPAWARNAATGLLPPPGTYDRDRWERRNSGLVVPRRGPRPKTPTEWHRWASDALAEHCRQTEDHPFDCDWECVGKATAMSPDYLPDAASQKGVRLEHIRAKAWATLGMPDYHFGKFS